METKLSRAPPDVEGICSRVCLTSCLLGCNRYKYTVGGNIMRNRICTNPLRYALAMMVSKFLRLFGVYFDPGRLLGR